MTPVQLAQRLKEAITHHQAGRLDQARPLYDEIRRAAPRNFDAAHLAGTLAYQQNRPADAAALLALALKLNPRSAVCEMRLGLALLALGRSAEAETRFRHSLALPDAPAAAWSHLANALRAQGKTAEALATYREAARRVPDSAEAAEQLASYIADTQGFTAALPLLRENTTRFARHPAAWCHLGLALVSLGHLSEAETVLDRALALDGSLLQAQLGRAFALQQACRIPEALRRYEELLALKPDHTEAGSARLLCLNYLDTLSPAQLFAEHAAYGRRRPPRRSPAEVAAPGPRNPQSRLRVGLVSPDLRRHSVAYFLEPLLRHLDPAQFEVILYHDHATVDDLTLRLKSHAAHWRPIAGQTDDAVEALIRRDTPDILVDLAGHTGFNRLSVFARRVAPVQVTYLGYPHTTGLGAMDYRLVDAITDPEGEADLLHTEKLVRFAPTAWAYEPPANSPVPPPPPASAGGPVSFGSFNNLAKLTDATLGLWGRVLAVVPGSRLVLKGHGLDDPAASARFRARLDLLGVSGDRLRLLGRTPDTASHLALYREIDIALDPTPYAGTTTTCEALWMGRPVVTLLGDRHAARVGASILTAIGRPEWIARDADAYVEIAASLARDPVALAARSAALRPALQASPLLDHPAQAARFGAALQAFFPRPVPPR